MKYMHGFTAMGLIGHIFGVFTFVVLVFSITNAERGNDCRVQSDIFFLLDNSGSVGKGNFRNIIKFVKRFPGHDLKIGPNDIRIGVMSYHTFVHREFGLDKYKNLHSFLDGVSKIKYHGGSTRTHLAIRRMYRKGFEEDNGARPGVAKICFIVTDGNSNHKYKTLSAASMAKKLGVIMFSIGVGDNVNMEELRGIAYKPNNNYVYKRTDAYYLKELRSTLVQRVCNVSRPKPPPGCSPKADIVFLLDSSGSIASANFKLMLEFVKKFFRSFPIGRDAYQFGVAAFSNDAYLEFHLHTNLNSMSLLTATDGIRYRGGGTNTDDAIRLARRSMFKSANGDRSGVPNLLVVITDGHAGDHDSTVREAKMARDAGIKLFAVGVTSKIDWSEIKKIASDPDDDHVVAVSSFSKLKEKIETFTKKVCKDTHSNRG